MAETTSILFEFDSEIDDKPREECGVFGIYAPGQDVAALSYNALFNLQHRGQDAAGIAVIDRDRPESILCVNGRGKIEEALQSSRVLAGLPESDMASASVRYSTIDTRSREEQDGAAMPLIGGGNGGSKFSLSYNGHLANFEELRAEHPSSAHCYTDGQLMTHLIGEQTKAGVGLYESIVDVTSDFNGAYSLVIMGENKLFGVRDPKGIRPLMLGKLPDGGRAIASEIAALDIIGATYEREVEAGEIVEISPEGLKSYKPYDPEEVEDKLCAFEFVYFSRPDNVLHGESAAKTRRKAGIELAIQFPVEDADAVIDVPDSGSSAAKGYAYATGLPLEEGLVKNKYVGRSFIASGQAQREEMIRAKFNVMPENVSGKNLVVVDDSLIRGTTMRGIVSMLRGAGAKGIHLRIASAPYISPCFYGMDTGNIAELIASGKSVEEICEYVGADSLAYLPVEDLKVTLGKAAGKVCMACMTGEYPTDIPEHMLQPKLISR
jgi:amidophosphoribosyltransferase